MPGVIDADTHIDETEATWEFMTEAEQAFKRVSEAYNELNKPRPIPLSTALPPKPETSLWHGIRKIGRGLRILKTV